MPARWRYTEWAGGEKGMQLFDHDKDPNEYLNMANDSRHAAVIAEMKALLNQTFPSRGIRAVQELTRKSKSGAVAK